MTHPLVKQLRFTRDEFKHALSGLTDDEASRRGKSSSISWCMDKVKGHARPHWGRLFTMQPE